MPLTVYGAMWCGDTRMARRVLDDKGFPYEWVDVDKDAQALAYVKEVSNGMSSIPVLGDVLVEPSESALTDKLETCQGGPTATCWSSLPT